ncbi:putative integral membrane protein [Theileria parva strain Muguga]|uniref:putative integral membrane protein n=1 Tax=Theileria parva strain Muguga TaxID=333668 RepID=UPI001C619167|nr:putative integral membrane protein [Theileria parva strain Muguga]KAF5153393.1 putative integral membrane protein [Theileria parva strain Muguga]
MEGSKALPRINVYKKLPGLCAFMMLFGSLVEISLINGGLYSDSDRKDPKNKSN